MIINNFSPIDLSVARKKIDDLKVNFSFEKIYFNDSLNRIICNDIISEVDVPNFDKSPLDGYAFKKEDAITATSEKPVRLEVIDLIMAGDVSEKTIMNGQAVRIMTGGKIPNGANCVVRYEDTSFTDRYVDIFSPIGKNVNIIGKGEDIKKGEIIIPKGTKITPAEIGVFASLGIEYIEVFKRPVVTVFSTGSELIEVSDKFEDGKIRNSNSYTVEQLAKCFGAEVIQKGIVFDDLKSLINAYEDALKISDIVVSTGGISVGDGDYVLTAMDKLGVNTVFTRVNAKPGGHVFAGTKGDKFLFGLSGNPAAAFINFYLYVKPVILKMQSIYYKPFKVKSILSNDFPKTAKVFRIVRANTYYKNGMYHSELANKQESGVLSSMVGKNSLIIIPPSEKLSNNDEVEAEFIYE